MQVEGEREGWREGVKERKQREREREESRKSVYDFLQASTKKPPPPLSILGRDGRRQSKIAL